MEQKFFLYARKSTDSEDMQVHSIEDQLSVLREFAKNEGLDIYEEFIEKQSAKIPGRPIFNEMIARLESGEASGILAWHPDRLARNSIDGGKILYLLDTEVIKSLKFPQFWCEPTAQGKFMLSLAFGQSKHYVDALSENTKRGLRQKAKRGEYPGLAPLGYINDPRTKTIVVHKKESVIISEMFTVFSRGTYLIKDMPVFLFQKGIKSKLGKPLHVSKVSKILRNPLYYGHFRYNGEIFEGKHEPIITKKLFDQVQEVLRKKDNHSWDKQKVVKPFLGLFHCGECGMMITAEQQTKFYKGTNRTVAYTYYHCTKKSKTQKCFQSYIREEDLDEQLSEMVKKVSLPPSWKTPFLKMWEEDKKQSFQSGFARLQEKSKEMTITQQKLHFLLDSFLDQTIDRPDYLERKEKLMAEKKNLEEHIKNIEGAQNDWLEPFKNWIERASEASTIASGKDLNAKKVLAQEIYGSNLTLSDQKARGEALNAWAALRAAPTGLGLVPRGRVELPLLF